MADTTHGGGGGSFGEDNQNIFDKFGEWWEENIFFTNPDGTKADTTIKDLLLGPTIEFEKEDSTWMPSIFFNDPFKAGTVVQVEDGPNGEVIIVNETDASKTTLIDGGDASEDLDSIKNILSIAGLTLLIGLIVGLIVD